MAFLELEQTEANLRIAEKAFRHLFTIAENNEKMDSLIRLLLQQVLVVIASLLDDVVMRERVRLNHGPVFFVK